MELVGGMTINLIDSFVESNPIQSLVMQCNARFVYDDDNDSYDLRSLSFKGLV